LNGIGFVIFGSCPNILQVFEVNLIVSPIVDSRLIHGYPGLTQKIREKCPKLTLQSLMMAIFIYEEMDQLRAASMQPGCSSVNTLTQMKSDQIEVSFPE
jgi:hypothetical protein